MKQNTVPLGYISEAIDELVAFLGIKKEISCDNLINLVHQGKIRESIKTIASSFGLPIEINLKTVSDEYSPYNTTRFESSGIVTTEKTAYGNRGVQSITAQVSIPGSLPFYGTRAMEGYPIDVAVSNNCNESPETFIAIMAHELAHILLNSLSFAKKDNEFYADLTPMILGYSAIIKNGRKVTKTIRRYANSEETLTTTYGYLSDEQFAYSFIKIKDMTFLQKACFQKVWTANLRWGKFLHNCHPPRNTAIKTSKKVTIITGDAGEFCVSIG